MFDLLAAIAATAFLLLVAAGVIALIAWVSPAFRRPDRLITDRWQATTDGMQARTPALAMEIALPGTTYMRQPGDRPPWVRFVVQIACGQVGDDPDWPRIRAAFETFVQKPAVAELNADLTHAGEDAAWARQATSTSSVIDMVLGDGVASARLELPDGIRRHGRVEGYALLVVHAEPCGADGKRASPASPSSWQRRFERALQLPSAFAPLLAGELRLAISGEPPAQAGIRLEATRDMADLVDITGLAALPGAHRLSQLMVYLAARPNGVGAASTAGRRGRCWRRRSKSTLVRESSFRIITLAEQLQARRANRGTARRRHDRAIPGCKQSRVPRVYLRWTPHVPGRRFGHSTALRAAALAVAAEPAPWRIPDSRVLLG